MGRAREQGAGQEAEVHVGNAAMAVGRLLTWQRCCATLSLRCRSPRQRHTAPFAHLLLPLLPAAAAALDRPAGLPALRVGPECGSHGERGKLACLLLHRAAAKRALTGLCDWPGPVRPWLARPMPPISQPLGACPCWCLAGERTAPGGGAAAAVALQALRLLLH